MKILIIGQTSLHWGRMEFGNIGNYYIIEPFIRELHRVFPGAEIKTTLQLSERFCKDEDVTVVPVELYYNLTSKDNLSAARKEVRLVDEYLQTGFFAEKTPYINAVIEADIIIDFSGDLWGDNANLIGDDRFEVGLLKDLVAQKLGKPTFLLAGSPGPFNNIRTKELAKQVFMNFTAVTNREPISTIILKNEGFDISNVKDLACPAFLFEPSRDEEINGILSEAGLMVKDKPVVGFIICGWNFARGPFDRWPREDSEYLVFAKAVEFITNEIGAKVFLMSHSNGFLTPPNQFKLIHGRDYPIIKQLQKVIEQRGIAKDVVALDGIYDPWKTKAIIGHFDLLVTGRVHAAVAGFSQCVPTVIIDYGHPPKAHKLRGFATVVAQEQYVCDPGQETDVLEKIRSCWTAREEVRQHLQRRIPLVKEHARENFLLIKRIVDNMA